MTTSFEANLNPSYLFQQGNCSRYQGGTPCQVVKGGDSCSEGLGFESRRLILAGNSIFSHIVVVRIVKFAEKTKINEKEAGHGPFKKIGVAT